MKWYVDSSDLHGAKEAELPDVVLLGGIAVPCSVDRTLRFEVEKAKAEFGNARAPVKWNMKDLKPIYEKQGQNELFEAMLKTSEHWRRRVFECLAATEAKIIIACIEGYSVNKQVLIKTRESLTRYAFSNGLMRFGLHAKEMKADGPSVIMDWPEKQDPKPFNNEYVYAYVKGTTADSGVPYICGKLENLDFADSVMFTNMRHSTLLQVADLVVGATRELVECALDKKSPGQGVECLRIVKGNFRGAPDKILGRGLSISSGNEELSNRVYEAFKALT